MRRSALLAAYILMACELALGVAIGNAMAHDQLATAVWWLVLAAVLFT